MTERYRVGDAVCVDIADAPRGGGVLIVSFRDRPHWHEGEVLEVLPTDSYRVRLTGQGYEVVRSTHHLRPRKAGERCPAD